MIYEFNITPVPKPRMTRRDKWLNPPRTAVSRYRGFADELRLNANLKGLRRLTGKLDLDFIIPMPASWSMKMKKEMNGKPHQPNNGNDYDNLSKSIGDIFESNDSFIYDVHITKYWGFEPKITITTYDN